MNKKERIEELEAKVRDLTGYIEELKENICENRKDIINIKKGDLPKNFDESVERINVLEANIERINAVEDELVNVINDLDILKKCVLSQPDMNEYVTSAELEAVAKKFVTMQPDMSAYITNNELEVILQKWGERQSTRADAEQLVIQNMDMLYERLKKELENDNDETEFVSGYINEETERRINDVRMYAESEIDELKDELKKEKAKNKELEQYIEEHRRLISYFDTEIESLKNDLLTYRFPSPSPSPSRSASASASSSSSSSSSNSDEKTAATSKIKGKKSGTSGSVQNPDAPSTAVRRNVFFSSDIDSNVKKLESIMDSAVQLRRKYNMLMDPDDIEYEPHFNNVEIFMKNIKSLKDKALNGEYDASQMSSELKKYITGSIMKSFPVKMLSGAIDEFLKNCGMDKVIVETSGSSDDDSEYAGGASAYASGDAEDNGRTADKKSDAYVFSYNDGTGTESIIISGEYFVGSYSE